MMHPIKTIPYSSFIPVDENRRFTASFYLLFCVVILVLWIKGTGWCQGWPDIKVRLLPDDCFAVVESGVGAKIRHSPHHDQNGRPDEEQLIYVLGTLDQETWENPKRKKVAQKHLEKHYERFRIKIQKKGLQKSVNINKAQLTELVALPQIGPVLAVKIVEFRNRPTRYVTIEDIKRVEGIGPGIFNSIRHYISTD